MIAYQAEAWHDLFVAVAGAAAALGGLFFVAVSLNLSQILEVKTLPSTAARSLSVLLGLLLLSIFALTPGQSRELLGGEVAALGLLLAVSSTISAARSHRYSKRWGWTLLTLLLALVSTVPMVIAGLSLIAGAGGGLYWAVLEITTGFSVPVYYSWILLIEIRR